jgi:hypothetical protein
MYKHLILILSLSGFTLAQNETQTFFGSMGLLNLSINEVSQAPRLINWSVGLQKQIINEKWRAVPILSFGNYQGGFLAQDITEAFYSSTSLKATLEYDYIKRTKYSYLIGFGIFLNHTRGHVGSVETFEYPYFYYKGRFYSYNVGVDFKTGVRFNSENKRFGYELILANTSLGITKDPFVEFSLIRFRLLFNLNCRPN